MPNSILINEFNNFIGHQKHDLQPPTCKSCQLIILSCRPFLSLCRNCELYYIIVEIRYPPIWFSVFCTCLLWKTGELCNFWLLIYYIFVITIYMGNYVPSRRLPSSHQIYISLLGKLFLNKYDELTGRNRNRKKNMKGITAKTIL